MGLRAAIFVVDDQRSVAEAAARYLRMHGFEVRVETDGWAAVRMLRSEEEEFVVTFLDVLMPEPTGGQIYNILKQFAPARLDRLVFYTGMTALAEGWLEETGLPIVEKGTDAPEMLLRWATHFARLDLSTRATRRSEPAPKGPMPPTKRQPSKPELDSDPPDDFADETTEVSRRARSGDVLAVKLKHLESKFHENKDATNERLEKIEGHFEEKGMVGEVKHDVIDIKTDLKIAKSWINRFPLVIGAIFTVLMSAGGAVVYLIHVSERDHDLQLQQQRYDEQKKKYDELLQKTSASTLPPPK